MSSVAVLLAGGSGLRFGSDVPKQCLLLNGKPVWIHACEAFVRSALFDRYLLVVPQEQRDLFFQQKTSSLDVECIEGGQTRQESSWRAVEYLKNNTDVKWISLHDAARPLVSALDIEKVFNEAQSCGAAQAVMPLTDTLIRAEAGSLKEVLDRKDLYRVLTPQMFDFSLFVEAHECARKENFTQASDDAILVQRLGHTVRTVVTAADNIKITHPVDLVLAEVLLQDESHKE